MKKLVVLSCLTIQNYNTIARYKEHKAREELESFKQSLNTFTEDNEITTNDEAFLEMAGRLPRDKSGRCKLIVAVGADERNIAHFHVFRSENDLRAWKNGACLYFTENKYYDHSDNAETLTKDELKELSFILKAQYKHFGITNWQHLVGLWNDNNDRYEIPEDTPMPDYDYKTILSINEMIDAHIEPAHDPGTQKTSKKWDHDLHKEG